MDLVFQIEPIAHLTPLRFELIDELRSKPSQLGRVLLGQLGKLGRKIDRYLLAVEPAEHEHRPLRAISRHQQLDV